MKNRFVAICALLGIIPVLVLVGCGSSSSDQPSPQATTSKIDQILGHPPTGLLKEMVDRQQMVVSNESNYPPQSYIDDNGELVGFNVDIAMKTAALLGLPLKMVQPKWDAVPTGLTTGRWDVSIGSMTPTPERRKTLDFTDPYYYIADVIVIKQGGKAIGSLEELRGKTVGVTAGAIQYTLLQEIGGVKIKTYDTDTNIVPDVINGRLDAMLTTSDVVSGIIASGQPLEITGKPVYYEDMVFATKKGENDLVAVLNWAIAEMHSDGYLTDTSKNWYHGLDLTVKQ